MKIILIFLFIFVNLCNSQVILANYFCGGDGFSRLMSFLTTSVCEQQGINLCCQEHDLCYTSCEYPQMMCDNAFCECLDSLPASLYCRNIVHASHCSLVHWFAKSFSCPIMPLLPNPDIMPMIRI